MAEEHCKADIKEQNRISLSNSVTPIIGQILTFLIFIAGLAAGLALAFKGISYGAVSAILAAITPIIVASIRKK